MRAAQSLDGRPSDGASALPRGRYLLRRATACKPRRFTPATFGMLVPTRTAMYNAARLNLVFSKLLEGRYLQRDDSGCCVSVLRHGNHVDSSEAEDGPDHRLGSSDGSEEHHAPTCPSAALSPLARSTA